MSGNLGADGSGQAIGFSTEVVTGNMGSTSVRAFVKEVWGTGSPSVNHMIIVQDVVGVEQTYTTDSDLDNHRLSGLENLPNGSILIYVLFAASNGYNVPFFVFQNVLNSITNSLEDLI